MSLLSRALARVFRQDETVLQHQETYINHKSRSILVASFSGICGYGCRCADSVAQMDRVVWKAMRARRPDGLIMDFRGLHYQWGDNLIGPLDYHPDNQRNTLIDDEKSSTCTKFPPSPFPVVYVISNLNRDALTSLLTDELMAPPSEYLFETIEAAMDAIADRLA